MNSPGPRPRTSRHIIDVPALYTLLDQRRTDRALSWDQVARQTGVCIATFSRIRRGKALDGDTLASLLAWAGVRDITGLIKPRPTSR